MHQRNSIAYFNNVEERASKRENTLRLSSLRNKNEEKNEQSLNDLYEILSRIPPTVAQLVSQKKRKGEGVEKIFE